MIRYIYLLSLPTISEDARNKGTAACLLLWRKTPFSFLNLSPLLSPWIVSITDIFLILLKARKEKIIIRKIKEMLVIIPRTINTSVFGVRVFIIKWFSINLQRGIPKIIPERPPITANAIYFTMKRDLYAILSTPIAFMVPISFSSLFMVAWRLKRILINISIMSENPIITRKMLIITVIIPALLDLLFFPVIILSTVPSKAWVSFSLFISTIRS